MYRFASTLGDRYAFPLMFFDLDAARAHEALHHKYLAGLPGADTMRIEVFTDDGWQPLDGGESTS